jgi:hypothetical protein
MGLGIARGAATRYLLDTGADGLNRNTWDIVKGRNHPHQPVTAHGQAGLNSFITCKWTLLIVQSLLRPQAHGEKDQLSPRDRAWQPSNDESDR